MKVGFLSLLCSMLLSNAQAQQFTQAHGSYFLSVMASGVMVAEHPTVDRRPIFSIGCDRAGLVLMILRVIQKTDTLNLSCASGWRASMSGLPYQDMLIASSSSSGNNRAALFRALDELKAGKCTFDLGAGNHYELSQNGLKSGVGAMEAACAAQGRLQ